MKIATKTLSVMITALFLGSLSCAYGDSNTTSDPNDTCTTPEDTQIPVCCPSTPQRCDPPPKRCPTFCTTAPGYCRSFEGWLSGFIDIEALYWRGSVDGLACSFGTTSINEVLAGGVLAATVTETDKDPNFAWRWGWRIGAGFNSCSGWNIEAYWTHLNGHAHKNESSDHGTWKLRYNVFDLDLGHDFWVSPCFLFKPFIGLRGAVIHESLNSTLTTVLTTGAGTASILIDSTAKQKFMGLGPEIGTKADWYLNYGFSLVGMLDFVLLYGNYKIHSNHSTIFPLAADIIHLKTRTDSIITGFDALLGIRWETYFSCKKRSFSLQLSGEHHSLFDFNKIGGGDLDLDGVTLSAAINF